MKLVLTLLLVILSTVSAERGQAGYSPAHNLRHYGSVEGRGLWLECGWYGDCNSYHGRSNDRSSFNPLYARGSYGGFGFNNVAPVSSERVIVIDLGTDTNFNYGGGGNRVLTNGNNFNIGYGGGSNPIFLPANNNGNVQFQYRNDNFQRVITTY